MIETKRLSMVSPFVLETTSNAACLQLCTQERSADERTPDDTVQTRALNCDAPRAPPSAMKTTDRLGARALRHHEWPSLGRRCVASRASNSDDSMGLRSSPARPAPSMSADAMPSP